MAIKSKLEIEFEELWLKLYPDIDLVNEFKAIPKRRFKSDYAHIKSKVLIEINGGTWVKNGHSSGKGIERDYIKNNLCLYNGYITFQLSKQMIDEEWLKLIAETIRVRESSLLSLPLSKE